MNFLEYDFRGYFDKKISAKIGYTPNETDGVSVKREWGFGSTWWH